MSVVHWPETMLLGLLVVDIIFSRFFISNSLLASFRAHHSNECSIFSSHDLDSFSPIFHSYTLVLFDEGSFVLGVSGKAEL
jgi:hypothetical protein